MIPVFSNAAVGIVVNEFERTTFDNDSMSLQKEEPMVVTVLGRVRFVKLLPENTELPILKRPSARLMDVIPDPLNASSPMLVTLPGTVAEVTLLLF